MVARRVLSAAALLSLTCSAWVVAGEVKSGVPAGKKVGAYRAIKCGGAEDGVRVNQQLCYTWRLGGRPVVFIFAKTPNDQLASLAKAIDKAVAKNKSQKLSAVINLIGEPNDEYIAKAKAFAKKNGLKNVVVTVTADADKFNVSDDAEVTVMNYVRKVVKFNYAVGKEGLTDKDIEAIIKGIDKIL